MSGGALPDSVQLYVDGVASGSPLTAGPYTFSWDTTKVADGSHTLMVRVTDAQSRTASSAVVNQTVDNTAPSTFVMAPAAGSFFQGSLPATAHASDAFGVEERAVCDRRSACRFAAHGSRRWQRLQLLGDAQPGRARERGAFADEHRDRQRG